jgi:hypothetical protein
VQKLTVDFTLEKETKGTFRYQEVEVSQPPVIGSLYIKKYATGIDPPKRIRVIVEPA